MEARQSRRARRRARRGRRDPARAAGGGRAPHARFQRPPAASCSRCRHCRLYPLSMRHRAGMRPVRPATLSSAAAAAATAARACARSGRLHSLCHVPTAVRFFRAPLGRRRHCVAALDLCERPDALPVASLRLKAAKSCPCPVRSALHPALGRRRAARPPAAAPLAAFLRLSACLIWPISVSWKSVAR